MAISAQCGFAHPAQQLPEAGVARGVGAQYQGVDEKAHQTVQGVVSAPCYRATQRDVMARTEAAEQCRETGLQDHEQAGPALAGQAGQLPVRLGIPFHQDLAAPVGGHGWAWAVGGQFDLLGQAS